MLIKKFYTNYLKRSNQFAFTLAETLITLVIVGIIAALTIPSIITKMQHQEYVSKLKKAYSTLAQATNLIIAEEGMPRADKGGWASSSINIYNLYKKYLINVKECNSANGCFNQTTKEAYKFLANKSSLTYDSNNINTNTSYGKLILNDGAQVLFNKVSDSCTENRWGSKNVCAWILVDINGEKKPNTYGRDYFGFALKNNGLYPYGCDEEGNCNGPIFGDGWACTCKVLREGAMNY